MNAIEEILLKGLQEAPGNWEVRLELIDKFSVRHAHDEALQLIAAAPGPPATEAEIRRIADCCVQAGRPAAAEPLLSAFVARKPASAVGHYLLAKLLSKIGDLDRARGHYTTTVALNAELEDEVLAAKLADFGQTMIHNPAQVAKVIEDLKVAEPAPEPTVQPIKPRAVISTPTPEVVEDDSPEAVSVDPEPESEAVAGVSALDQIPALEADVAAPQARAMLPPVPDLMETAAHMAYTAPVEAHAHLISEGDAEMIEFEAGANLTRHIVLSEPGERIQAMERKQDTGQKIGAVAIAVLAHIALIVILGLVIAFTPSPQSPEIITTAAAVLDDNRLEQQEINKQVQRKPVQASQAMTEVVSVSGMSQVALPDIKTDLIAFEPIGLGDTFGSSMSFGAGVDGGMVSFFGSRSTSKKVVFAVDFSASMKSMDKDTLMRKELSKSLMALPTGIAYQCIFFAGPAWYHGETVNGPNENPTIKAEKGRDEWKWMSKGGATNFFPAFTEDPEKLPKLELLSSSRSNLRNSVKLVEETKLVWGTDWRWPLYMAMNLEPDTIFFMTDGAWGGKQDVLDELIEYNNKHGRAKINTICMMVPQAMEKLQYLAEKSRGECSLVQADQSVLRGKELADFLKKKK